MCGACHTGTEKENLENLTDTKKMLKRIICVGNRLMQEDIAGPMVFDQLATRSLPNDVELIDGGLAGLDLLRFISGADLVIFVDTLNGFESSNPVRIVSIDDAARHADAIFDHSAGLTYLLQILPHVHEGKLPEIFLVGIEDLADPHEITNAAELCLELIQQNISHGLNK